MIGNRKSIARKVERVEVPVKMFDYFLVIDLIQRAPQISHCFPEVKDNKTLQFLLSIPQFCFPEGSVYRGRSVSQTVSPRQGSIFNFLGESPINQNQETVSQSEQFSFILTAETGDRLYGFCLRGPSKTGELRGFCILSKIAVSGIQSRIVHVAEARHSLAGWESTKTFLTALEVQKMPKAGGSFNLDCPGINNGRVERYGFTRPADSERYLENVNFTQVLQAIPSQNLVCIFASLLYERRILFCSQNVSLLSNCVQGCITILYPFNWQFVLVPVLPGKLIDFVCAPMPFVLGISSHDLPKVLALGSAVEEVVLYDLDKSVFLSNPHHDDSKLPPEVKSQITEALTYHSPHEEILLKTLVHNNSSEKIKEDLNTKVADVFLGFFVQLLHGYDAFIVGHSSFGFMFDEKGFVNHFPQQTQEFVGEFVKTQLFKCFIEEREKHIDHYTGTTFETKVHMLASLLKAMKREGISDTERMVLREGINKIFGIVPSRVSVLLNSLLG